MNSAVIETREKKLLGVASSLLDEIADDPTVQHALVQQLLAEYSFQRFVDIWVDSGGRINRAENNSSNLLLFDAYFYHTLSAYIEPPLSTDILTLSYELYEKYTKALHGTPETLYFAQWQKGLVQELLGANWSKVEETLLGASMFCRERGEALRHIVQHYRSNGEFGLAYMYSSITLQQHHGRIPEHLTWFGDIAYYQWKILNYHSSICKRVNNEPETKETFAKLWEISLEHPEYFTPEQMDTLFGNQKAFQQ